MAGKSYEEITSGGGGIISSVKGIREASEEELFEGCLERVNFFLAHGTTTIEAKSGYGLTTEDELKSLRVIKRLNKVSKLDIIPTFMGAHDIPPEFKDNPTGYVDLICAVMLPAVAEEDIAEYCDVFCEKGYFSIGKFNFFLIFLSSSQHEIFAFNLLKALAAELPVIPMP